MGTWGQGLFEHRAQPEHREEPGRCKEPPPLPDLWLPLKASDTLPPRSPRAAAQPCREQEELLLSGVFLALPGSCRTGARGGVGSVEHLWTNAQLEGREWEYEAASWGSWHFPGSPFVVICLQRAPRGSAPLAQLRVLTGTVPSARAGRLHEQTPSHVPTSVSLARWGGTGWEPERAGRFCHPVHVRLVSLSSAGYQADLRQLQQPRHLTPGIATARHGGRPRLPRSGGELSRIPRGTALRGSGVGQGGGSGVLLLDGLGAELLGTMMFNSSKKKTKNNNKQIKNKPPTTVMMMHASPRRKRNG